MIKSLLPQVSKELGKSGAFILNQLALLFKSFGNKTNKIYRTDKELFDDLEGLLSQSTIKRNKKVLVEKGYIQISFDKGFKRQTYYSLTEKAIAVLEEFIHNIREYITPVENNSASDIKNNETVKEIDSVLNTKETKSMEESFNDGFSNKNAVPMPKTVKEIFIGDTKESLNDSQKEIDVKDTESVEHKIVVSNFKDLIKTKKSNVQPSEESLSFKEKLMNMKSDVVDTVNVVKETCNIIISSKKEDELDVNLSFDEEQELSELRNYNNQSYELFMLYD